MRQAQKVFVCAGTAQQAQKFIKDCGGIGAVLFTPEQLRGHTEETAYLFYCGTYYQRKDFREIQALVKAGGIPTGRMP